MIKKHPFNLIEITLALMVISIGVMAIMGLIPIGTSAHRDAIHQNHSADAAEEIINYTAIKLLQNWTTTPISKPDPTTGPADIGSWTKMTDAEAGSFWYQHGSSGLFRMLRTHEALRDGGTVTVHEFDAVFAVWLDNVTGIYIDGSGPPQSQVLDNIMRINVEVSWPGAVPYASRTKAYYSLEVKKP